MARNIDGTILDGIRYKRGSVKIIEKENKYYVEEKKYLFFKFQYYKKRCEYETLGAAENEFARIAANLYKIS